MSASESALRGLRSAWPWLVLAGALVLWTVASRSAPMLPDGGTAPSLQVTTTDGELDLAEQRGRVTVLAFWATWCGACRAEAPVLDRVHRRISGHGDQVVGLSVDTLSLDQVGHAASRLGMSYPVAVVSPEDTERFQVELLPTVYVIAPDGQIAQSFTGVTSERRLLAAVEAARDPRISAR